MSMNLFNLRLSPVSVRGGSTTARRTSGRRRVGTALVALTLAATGTLFTAPAQADPGQAKGSGGSKDKGAPDTASVESAAAKSPTLRSKSDPEPGTKVPAPALPIDTMVTQEGSGRPGIRVGTKTYSAPYLDGKESYRLTSDTAPRRDILSSTQVLVLNQQTSALVWNRTYANNTFRSPDKPGLAPVPASLKADLTALQKGKATFTVIVSAHAAPGFDNYQPILHGAELAPLEVEWTPESQNTYGVRGGFSLVAAVSGRSASPQYRWSPSPTTGAGRAEGMTGMLVLNESNNYRFIPTERLRVDTRSGGGCDGPGTNCDVRVTVNGSTETYARFGGAGFLVTVWDKLTLEQQERAEFATNGGSGAAEATAMAHFLTGLRHHHAGDLVVVTSVRTQNNNLVGTMVPYQAMLDLSEAIASVGGTRNTFNRASGQSGSDYTLIGWSTPDTETELEGKGREASGAKARIQAVLTRNSESLFRPTLSSSGMAPADDLASLALSPTTKAWPTLSEPVMDYLDKDAKVRADGGLPADPRRAYWTKDWDGARWLTLAGHIADADPPTDYTNLAFGRLEFLDTQAILRNEMNRVGLVRERIASLQKPIDDLLPTGNNQDDVKKVIAALYDDQQEKTEVEFDWEGLMESLVAIIAVILPEALVAEEVIEEATAMAIAHSLHGAAGVASLGAWIGENENKSASFESITIKGDEVLALLNESMNATNATYERMGDLVVADPGKLQTMGETWCADRQNPQPDYVCNADDKADVQSHTKAAIKRANERLIYTKLTPLVYAKYDLGPTYSPLVDGGVDEHEKWLHSYSCGAGWSFPFDAIESDGSDKVPEEAIALPRQGDYVPMATYYSLTRDPDPHTQPWTWWPTLQPHIMAFRRPNSPQWLGSYPKYPSEEILDRMFGPVTAGDDTKEGGLGMSKDTFIPSLPANYLIGCGWLGQEGKGRTPEEPPGKNG